MLQLKRKKSFVAPFSHASIASSQNLDIQPLRPNQNEKKPFSPVHICQHVQIITPKTKKKIKQRFAMGFSRVSTRDTSPGFYVPFDLSQSSCLSQQVDANEARSSQSGEECDKKSASRDVVSNHTDQADQDFGEEFDLELLEEAKDINSMTEENGTHTENLQKDYANRESKVTEESTNEYRYTNSTGQNEKNATTCDIEFDGLPLGKVTVLCTASETESDKINTDKYYSKKSDNDKRRKKEVYPKSLSKTNMLIKRFKPYRLAKARKLVGKSEDGLNGRSLKPNVVSQKRRKVSRSKETPAVSDEFSIQTGIDDFRPLTLSNQSRYQCDLSRRIKCKLSKKLIEKEVLKTLLKMHDEIRELLEHRKQLCLDIEQSRCMKSEKNIAGDRSGISIVQEE